MFFFSEHSKGERGVCLYIRELMLVAVLDVGDNAVWFVVWTLKVARV